MFKLLISLLLFSNPVLAVNKISCSTSPLTTSYILTEETNNNSYNQDKSNGRDKSYKLSVIHHNGILHAPLITGTFTQSSFKIANKRIENLKLMGDSFSLSFDECNFKEERLYCFKDEESLIGKLKVKNSYFSAHKELHSTPFGDFNINVIRFNYRTTNNESHDMNLDFYDQACRFF